MICRLRAPGIGSRIVGQIVPLKEIEYGVYGDSYHNVP